MSKKRDLKILNNVKLGAIESPIDDRDLTYEMAKVSVSEKVEIPKSYRTEGNVKVMHQLWYPTCVPYAVATALAYGEYKLGHKVAHNWSRGFIYGNRVDTDTSEGMYPRQALKAVNKEGDCLYSDFPHNLKYPEVNALIERDSENLHNISTENKITSYFRLYNEEEIKRAIMECGAVIISINIYNSFTGNCPLPSEDDKLKGGHCMAMVGWDETGWIIQNSWGKNWGNNGFLHLPYEYPVKEVWGIAINSDIPEAKEQSTFDKICTSIKCVLVRVWGWISTLFVKKD